MCSHLNQHRPEITAARQDMDTVNISLKERVVHDQCGVGLASSPMYSAVAEPKNIAIFDVQFAAGVILDTL